MTAIVPPPLLHVGQAALNAGAPDLRIAALAAMAFAGAAAAIWWPALPSAAALLRRRIWLSLGRRLVIVMVALAVLPAILPYDHLFAAPHMDGGADESIHVSHCHVSPGTCSDAPLASGLGQLLFSEPLVIVPAMLAIVLMSSAVILQGVYPQPEIRPPVLRVAL
jgi:hypothetical protein